MYQNLAIIAVFVFIYSLVSGRLERTPFNGAIIFIAFGLAFGPLGFGLINLQLDEEGLSTFAELTLAFILFTDAANANLKELSHSYHLPGRLLLFGLPLTILLGFIAGVVIFDGLTLFEIAILATIVAPTDAALGKAVVTNDTVPTKIREGLNVESGLNDGICVPILFVFLALAITVGADEETPILVFETVMQSIGVGVAVGIGLSYLSVRLITTFANLDWVTETWSQLPVPALAVICFAVSQWLGGSGFIACFVGGMLFGRLEKSRKHKLLLAAEGTGDTLALITWIIFGAGVVGQNFEFFRWQYLVYALLSLTLIRMVPVFLVLTGMNLRTDEKLFMGWFGPRGLASIVFAVIVLNSHLPGSETITMTVVCTIILSVIVHGLSANPLVHALGTRINNGSKTKK